MPLHHKISLEVNRPIRHVSVYSGVQLQCPVVVVERRKGGGGVGKVGPGQLHKRVWTSSLSRTSQGDNFSESFANSLSTVNGMNKRSATSYLQSGVICSCLFFKQLKGRGELKAGRFIKS